MAADERMIINTDEMMELADSMRKCHQAIKGNVEQGKAAIDQIKGVWTGNAAETFSASFNAYYNVSNELLVSVNTMANSLNEAAQTYAASAKKMQNEAANVRKLSTTNFK